MESENSAESHSEEEENTYQKLAKKEQNIRKRRMEYAKQEWDTVKQAVPPVELVASRGLHYQSRGVADIRQYYDHTGRIFHVTFAVITNTNSGIPIRYRFEFSDGYKWYETIIRDHDYATVRVQVLTNKGSKTVKSKEKILHSREELTSYIEHKIPEDSQNVVGKILLHYWDNNVFFKT